MRPSHRITLTERDLELAVFVGRCGVVTLHEISRTFWGDSPGARVAAARRTRHLVDHGYLDCAVTALHASNRFSLTPLGGERVGHLLGPGEVLRTRIRGNSAASDHLVAAAEVWSCMLARLGEGAGASLARFVTEAEIRRALGRADRALIPDGLAVIEARASAGTGTAGAPGVVFAIEVDLGHEPADVFTRKASRYAAYLGRRAPLYGIPVDALLVYAPGLRRGEALARAIALAGVRDGVFLQDLEGLDPERVLDGLASVDALIAGRGLGAFTTSFLTDLAA